MTQALIDIAKLIYKGCYKYHCSTMFSTQLFHKSYPNLHMKNI